MLGVAVRAMNCPPLAGSEFAGWNCPPVDAGETSWAIVVLLLIAWAAAAIARLL